MKPKSLKTKKDYQQALERLELIFDAKKGTPEGEELEMLGVLIDTYENQHFPIDFSDDQKKTERAFKKNNSIMKNTNLTSLDQFIDKQMGSRGTKRREKFESGYEVFKLSALDVFLVLVPVLTFCYLSSTTTIRSHGI